MALRRSSAGPAALLAIAVIATFGVSWSLVGAFQLGGENNFNVPQWEMRHLAGKWLYLSERLWAGKLPPDEENARVERMLAITAEIGQRRAQGEDPQELESLSRERDSIENDVEAIIEGRLTSILENNGMESSAPLLGWPSLVWPPVDFEFSEPLPVLSVSSRERIERIEGRPLRLGLNTDEAVEIESRVQESGEVSAIVDAVDGVATYPSLVAYDDDYRSLVQTVAHEWVHHYLFFEPLGRHYLDSPALRTINETVADIVSRDIATQVVDRYPIELSVPAGPPEQEGLNGYANAVLRGLRLDVEFLLAAGLVDEAERLMEERRLQLVGAGIRYRRINQAFFAARSFYADSPASIDPIGPKLQALREGSSSLQDFLETTAELTSVSDLDRALAAQTPN
jgi:hypothetical protein